MTPNEDEKPKRVLLSLNGKIIKQLDELSMRDSMSRSTTMRLAILEYLRKPENAAFFKSAETGEDKALKQVLEEFNRR